MARLAWFSTASYARATWWIREHAQRAFRQHGLYGVFLILGVFCIFALSAELLTLQRRAALLKASVSSSIAPGNRPDAASVEQGQQARLQSFNAYLSPYEDVPDIVQAMFRLAQSEGLSMQRGDYKRDLDVRGQFVRYRMNLPLKGDAQAIYRFILSALQDHQSLALEAVQFRRDRIDAKDVEVNIQWVLLARLPSVEQKPVQAQTASIADNHE